MKIQKFIIITGCVALMGSFLSCSIKNTPPQPIIYYTLDYEKPVFEPKPTLPVSLAIEPFKTVAPYDTHQIIYSNDEFSQNKYYYYQWMSVPDEMITHLLTRDLIASNYFDAVMPSDDIALRYQLYGSIDKFYEQDTNNRWFAVLSVTITLIDGKEKNPVKQFCLQKNYNQIQPLAQKNPKSLARAMSTAMSKVSALIIADIYDVFK